MNNPVDVAILTLWLMRIDARARLATTKEELDKIYADLESARQKAKEWNVTHVTF